MSNRPFAHAFHNAAATMEPEALPGADRDSRRPGEGPAGATVAAEGFPPGPMPCPDLPAGLVPAAALTHALPRAGVAAPGKGGAVLGLARGRVHEFCGPGRRTLALLQAGAEGPATGDPVIWIAPIWASERIYAPGIAQLVDPGRLLLVLCPRGEDLFWAAEEALRTMAAARSGAVVVVELTAPPGLTPVRRLHLAASGGGGGPDAAITQPRTGSGSWNSSGSHTGGSTSSRTGRNAPLGLLLTPGNGGAAGVETRWHIAPDHGPNRSAWGLQRLRARGAGPAAWHLTETADDRHHLTPTPVSGPPPPAWGP